MEMAIRREQPTSTVLPMIIIGTLFFVFGFVTWLNGSLIPFLRLVCHLTVSQALLVPFVFYIAYVLMALPSSWVLNRIGYKNGMVAGLGIMAVRSSSRRAMDYFRSLLDFSEDILPSFLRLKLLLAEDPCTNKFAKVLLPPLLKARLWDTSFPSPFFTLPCVS